MGKLWLVQKNKDGTYGNWKEFKENKEGIIFKKGKIYRYVYGDNVDNQGIIQEKEVKKLKPYFELEVVKVKEEEKEWIPDYCPCCGARTEKKKDNWINGENLDKIKFPCFGWYLSGVGRRYCELDFIKHEKSFYRIKELKQHNKKDYSHAEFRNYDLKRLIKSLDFHILKGKIIIFEEE